MPPNSSDEDHEAFRLSVREFVERTLAPHAQAMIEGKSIPRELWQEAGKQGLFGLDIPEELGGAGAEDYRFNAVASEEISALCSCAHQLGRRWKTVRSPTLSAIAPITCTPVAPVPMTATRLPVKSTSCCGQL